MFYPIAIEMNDKDKAYGVVVPDIKGCYSAGETLEEAIQNAKEAIIFHLEALSCDGIEPPVASELNDLEKNPDFIGWTLAVVNVDE